MTTDKHTHQYIRIKLGKNKRIHFKCAVRGCVHNCKPELVIGRWSICNVCFNEFVLTSRNTQLAKPHCDDCTVKRNKSSDTDRIAQLLLDKDI